MKREELLQYEAPWYTEYVSIGWMQTVIAWFLARKVNRKLARYNHRKWREGFLKGYRI